MSGTLNIQDTNSIKWTSDGTNASANVDRITPRVDEQPSASSYTIDTDNYDAVLFTALAANLTLAAPTGTPTNGQPLLIRIKDNGTSRTLTFSSKFRALGVALPSATTISKTTYLFCRYNEEDSKWDVYDVRLQDDPIQTQLIAANRQTSSYTLALTDANKLVEINNGSANNLTIPPNSSVAFPVGTQIVLAQYGAGQTTVVAGSGVTIRSSGGKLKLTGQYSGATLIKIATDEWYLFGDITS